MLASNPASILNHILPQSGIPFDSLKTGNALGRVDSRDSASRRNMIQGCLLEDSLWEFWTV